MANFNLSPIIATSGRSLDLAGNACATPQVQLPDEARNLLLLNLVRALARQAAAEAWGQANPKTCKEPAP